MSRQNDSFNSDWLFTKLSAADKRFDCFLQELEAGDMDWEPVILPHTWNASDWMDWNMFYCGKACYRKQFRLDGIACGDKRIFLEFGAANTTAEVFLNGNYIGKHEGGYSAFRFDITEHVHLEEENSLVVRVSNEPTDYIAPIAHQGDFTKMGGLYREVRLIVTDEVHIDLLDYGSSGIYITPKNISGERAEADIVVKLANDDKETHEVTVTAEIYNEEQQFITSCSKKTVLRSEERDTLELAVFLANPVLWNGRKNPYLYRARVIVQENGKELDSQEQTFGIRTYGIDAEKGFFLNGEYLDLRGVNYHQDSWENGWAMTDTQRERDYQMMTDMGCTAVRMAHYQHAPQEYDLCDRMGLCVWTELGIVNKMSADPTERLTIASGFAENAKQQLRELIRQNYNHPSVVVWGISNELYQMSEEIYALYQELHTLADTEDPSRPKTFADAQFWGKFLELPGDVVGYNRYFGWYKEAGPVERFGGWLDSYHTEKESRPVCVSEYGGGAAISQHKDRIDWETEIDPWGERHYENYQSALHEAVWKQFAARDYLWGKFIWCMFDFASTGRKEGDTTGINDKGLATRERMPKDSFYFYKSVWNEEPMLHLTEKRFVKRSCNVPQVKAYCNLGNVELFVNGKSQGMQYHKDSKEPGASVYVWNNITLEAGKENHIVVKTILEDGTVLTDEGFWIGEAVIVKNREMIRGIKL